MYFDGERRIRNETLREEVIVRRHRCGLEVYLCPRPGFQKRYACFATDYGSMDSSFRVRGGDRIDVPDGVAHFLEHQLFEQPGGGNASDDFSRLGASSNAYTSFATTNYLFSCNERFDECLRVLIDFVQTPCFTAESVQKEQGIIAEEISMYEDNPGWVVYFNLLAGLYHDHPVRKQILGTVESIRAITDRTLYQCYETFYHPENMVLFAIGDIDPGAYFELVDSVLSARSFELLGEIERFRPEEPAAIHERSNRAELVVSMPRIAIGFKDQEAGGGRGFLAREQATDMLLEIIFGRGGRFFQKLYEEKLIDDSFGSHYSGLGEVGFSVVSGETPEPERLAERVLEEIDRVRRTGLDEADFERQRRSTLGSFFRQFNSLEFIANNFCGYRFLDVDLFDLVDVTRSLTLSDLHRRLDEHLREENVARSIVRPAAVADAGAEAMS